MAFGKKTELPEGASPAPIVGTQEGADPAARLKDFDSPPIDPTAKVAGEQAPTNDPASIIKPNTEGVMFMPSPEEKAKDEENARKANEAAGVKPADPNEKLSTEDRLTRIERVLRSQGHIA